MNLKIRPFKKKKKKKKAFLSFFLSFFYSGMKAFNKNSREK